MSKAVACPNCSQNDVKRWRTKVVERRQKGSAFWVVVLQDDEPTISSVTQAELETPDDLGEGVYIGFVCKNCGEHFDLSVALSYSEV